MKIRSIVLASIIVSVVISSVIACAAFFILRDIKVELERNRSLQEVIGKTHALNTLVVSFKEGTDENDILQTRDVRGSLDELLKKLSSMDAREKLLFRQLQTSNLELGALIDQMFAKGSETAGDLGKERRSVLASQIWIKVRFISDDTNRLVDISQSRIISAQGKAGITILSLILALILTNTIISLLSGRSVVQAQEALLVSEERLQMALDSARMGVFDYNAVSGELFCDDTIKWVFGFSADEPVNLEKSMERIHPQDGARVDQLWQLALDPQSNGVYEAEYRIVLPDGSVRWTAAKGQVYFQGEGESRGAIRMCGVNIDATERKRGEQALRESEERYRIMGEILPYGVWLCDAQGRTEYVSDSFLDLLNMSMEEMKGFGWSNRLVSEDVPGMLEKWFGCVRTGAMWDDEHRIIDRHGNIHTILTRGLPTRDKEGSITGWAGINLDITERKRMEEELRKSRDELELRVQERTAELTLTNRALQEYAEKLERLNAELNEFAWVASHDLQEPLRKIMTFGDRLSRLENSLGEQGRDDLDRMIKSVGRMASLVRSLASYASMTKEIMTSQPIDLKEVAEEVAGNLELSISEAGGHVEIGDLPTIEADAAKMRRLFQNLISNAIKYTREQEKPHVRVTGTIVDNMCRIEVEDNGIGFEERYLERIFKPFQRLHGRSSRFDGTGMGLTICRKVADLHGGSITARSKPGVGSTFIVSLPVKQGAHQRDTI